MATSASYIELEEEVVALLCGQHVGGTPRGHPDEPVDSWLVALNRWAQESRDGRELTIEGAKLASIVLDTQFYAIVLLNGSDESFAVNWYKRAAAGSSRHGMENDAKTSSLAFALDAAHPIILEDPGTDTRFHDTFLMERDVQSGIICPVGYANRKYGAIAVFTDVERSFDCEDVMFLQTIAHLLGPRLAYEQAEKKLAEHGRIMSATIDSLDSIVILIGDDERIQRINRACEEVTGFTINDLKTRQFRGALFSQEEAEVVRNAIAELRERISPVRCETDLLTKAGERRRIAWSFAFLPESTKKTTFVITGIDITDYVDAVKELERSRSEHDAGGLADLSPSANAQTSDEAPCETDEGASESGEYEGNERRAHKRRPYPCKQAIAPLHDGQLPAATDFTEVQCHDISAGGFSFLFSEDPSFDELVVAFGSYPAPLYMKARIVHVTPVNTGTKKIKQLIGCQYTGRVNLSTSS